MDISTDIRHVFILFYHYCYKNCGYLLLLDNHAYENNKYSVVPLEQKACLLVFALGWKIYGCLILRKNLAKLLLEVWSSRAITLHSPLFTSININMMTSHLAQRVADLFRGVSHRQRALPTHKNRANFSYFVWHIFLYPFIAWSCFNQQVPFARNS